MRTSIRLFVCTLLLAFTVFAAPPETAKLSGTVTDVEGGIISDANILVLWDPSGSGNTVKSNVGIKVDLKIQTGKDGSFSVNLPPGFYDVFVSATSFTPTCRKIRVREDQSFVFSPKLKADPVVSKELD